MSEVRTAETFRDMEGVAGGMPHRVEPGLAVEAAALYDERRRRPMPTE